MGGGEGGTAKKKRLKRGKVSDEIASTLETCSLKRPGSRMHGIRRRKRFHFRWMATVAALFEGRGWGGGYAGAGP